MKYVRGNSEGKADKSEARGLNHNYGTDENKTAADPSWEDLWRSTHAEESESGNTGSAWDSEGKVRSTNTPRRPLGPTIDSTRWRKFLGFTPIFSKAKTLV